MTVPEWHGAGDNPFNPHAWVVGEPTVGEGCWIGAFTVIDGSGGLTIGDGVDVSCGAQIYTHSTARRCVSGRAHPTVDRRPTTIGDHVFIGCQASIIGAVTIGDDATVAANSLVISDIPAGCTAIGVPVKILPTISRRVSSNVAAIPSAEKIQRTAIQAGRNYGTSNERNAPARKIRGTRRTQR